MNSSPSSDSSLDQADVRRHERYFVGVDLGQSNDPTAIAGVRRVDLEDGRPVFQVGYLERLPLGTPYPGVVTHVERLLKRPPFLGRAELVIDHTGVGRPVFDLFITRGVSPIGVSITSGDVETFDANGAWRVPKLTLISRLQALLHDSRLKIHRDLPEARTLTAELQDFKAEVTDSGYWRFGARSGKHDDLVLAVAIACWRGYGGARTGILEFYRQQASADRAAASSGGAQLLLRAPAGTTPSHLHTVTGRIIAVTPDGLVRVSAEEAKPLVNAGWKQIEKSDEVGA